MPAGTSVGCNSWVLHHDQDIFGQDADDYLPERWLGDPERVNRTSKYDFSFGMGARECAGKQVALVEVQKTVVQVRLFCFVLFGTLVPLLRREAAMADVVPHVQLFRKSDFLIPDPLTP